MTEENLKKLEQRIKDITGNKSVNNDTKSVKDEKI